MRLVRHSHNRKWPSTLKANSHIACRSPAMPCSYGFNLLSAAVSDSHLPCHAHAMFRQCRSSQGHSTARPSLYGRAVLWPREERHGKCESDTAALCKSNGKNTFQTLSGTACQGNGMGMACYVCESAFTRCCWIFCGKSILNGIRIRISAA